MSKRKRDESNRLDESDPPHSKKMSAGPASSKPSTNIQIITGSYERVLHGIHATLPTKQLISSSAEAQATFTDTFLFTAHASSIRSLALSPPSDTPKLILASGSSDGLINLYSLSTITPRSYTPNSAPTTSTNTKLPLSRYPRNRELGSLTTHTSAITALSFPTRSKLLSASSDNTIAITRTRDWTAFSTIKAPIPKPVGRPSGDTAAPGEVPAGINDFAVHPSMKLMLTVGKGEKCMRLWNLVTGKKAGVLNFRKDMLQELGEGRFGTGEGRRVLWSPDGEEFVVGFERAGVVFGMDCKPKGRIVPMPGSKICQMHYLPSAGDGNEARRNMLAVSTEDGRILFFDTKPTSIPPTPPDSPPTNAAQIPLCTIVVQLGGRSAGVRSRIKDFEILALEREDAEQAAFVIVMGSSDGIVRIWTLDTSQLAPEPDTPRQVGNLVGVYETGNRVTCLKAFVMTGVASGVDGDEEGAEEWKGVSGREGSSDSESDDSE